MRDKKRIERIIFKLWKRWAENPDWRLGQLISNLQGPGVQDVFYTEDDVWEQLLDKKLK